MKPLILPAFVEGSKSGYNAILQYLTRSFLARRASAVHKAAFLSDLADACSKLAKDWRERAFADAFSDGDLAPYTRLHGDGTPLDPDLFGKEFVLNGLHCQVCFERDDLVRRLLSDPEFLASDDAQDIAQAHDQLRRAAQRVEDLSALLTNLCASYAHAHDIPDRTCRLRGTLKIIDK